MYPASQQHCLFTELPHLAKGSGGTQRFEEATSQSRVGALGRGLMGRRKMKQSICLMATVSRWQMMAFSGALLEDQKQKPENCIRWLI